MSRLRAAILCGLAMLIAGPAGSDVLVTVYGERIETQGPWEVKGRLVTFTSARGVLSSLRLSEVDLAASDAATAEAAAAAQADAEEESEPAEKKKAVLVLTDEDIGSASEEQLDVGVAGTGASLDEVDEAMVARVRNVITRIGLRIMELDLRLDILTPEGMSQAAPDLRALADDLRAEAMAESGEVQEFLDIMASDVESLAAMAEQNPRAAIAKIRTSIVRARALARAEGL